MTLEIGDLHVPKLGKIQFCGWLRSNHGMLDISWHVYKITSSTAQGGCGSFKNRKPIGEIGCCESGMAERSHWWIERRLISLTLSLTVYLPTYLSSYVSIYLSISLSSYLSLPLSLSFDYSIYLSIDRSIYLSIYLSLSLSLSSVYLSSCLPVYLFIYLSISLSLFHRSMCLAV